MPTMKKASSTAATRAPKASRSKTAATARGATSAGAQAAPHQARKASKTAASTSRKSAAKKAATTPSTTRRTPVNQAVPEAIAKARAVAKAKAVAPGVAARIGSTPATKYRGNPDIFGRLVEDHDRHRALLAMITETSGASSDRKRLFKELVLEIKGHAAAEEQALWSTVMRNPATTEDARHAVGEHKEMDKMMADLAARDMASSGWLRHFDKLREEYLHHIAEEEQEQFKAAEKHLSQADVRYMKQVFNRRKAAEKADAKVEKKIRLK